MTSKEIAELQSSMVQVKIGDKFYPAVKSKRCAVCMHPGRMMIEEKLMRGFSYPAIVKAVSGVEHISSDGSKTIWPEVNPTQVGYHWREGHCPLDTNMVQILKEQRANEMGIELEASTEEFVDHFIVAHAVLNRGYERLIKGEINPDTKDLLAASKLLSDWSVGGESGPGQEDWSEFVQVFFEVVRENVDDQQWDRISRSLAKHPVLKALQEGNTIDAEEV